MKRFPLVLLVLVVSALFAGACAGNETEPNAAAFQADVDRACDGQENVETLKLVITPVLDSVKAGDTAQFRAKVVRTVDLPSDLKADLLRDSRNPDFSVEQPVEDASVGMSFTMPGLPAWGLGTTDQDGTALIRVKVRRSAPSGSYDADAAAFRSVAEGPCVHVSEEGSWHKEAALTVK